MCIPYLVLRIRVTAVLSSSLSDDGSGTEGVTPTHDRHSATMIQCTCIFQNACASACTWEHTCVRVRVRVRVRVCVCVCVCVCMRVCMVAEEGKLRIGYNVISML